MVCFSHVNDNVGNAEGTNGERFFSFQGCGKSITGGSKGNGAPVGHLPKAKVTRTSQSKRAVRPHQGSNATIEVADTDPQSHFLRKQRQWFSPRSHTLAASTPRIVIVLIV